jgi:hypothetical protein
VRHQPGGGGVTERETRLYQFARARPDNLRPTAAPNALPPLLIFRRPGTPRRIPPTGEILAINFGDQMGATDHKQIINDRTAFIEILLNRPINGSFT